MKKTFQVNINGKIFHIDEDAYILLQNYLSQLRAAFPGEEGEEIVSDIECRISEHFDQRILSGRLVIVLDDVNNVISVMGRPEQLQEEAECTVSGSQASAADETSACPPPYTSPISTPRPDDATVPPPYRKKLFRDVRHKVFGGVLAGLGQYLNWDVTVLRILVVVCTLFLCSFGAFWTIILAYLICWMVIPPANTPRDILEMRGEPVTVDTVGQTVIDSSTPPDAPVPSGNSFVRTLNSIFAVVGRVILVILGIVGGITAFTMAVLAMVVMAGMLCLYLADSPAMLESMEIFSTSAPYMTGWGMTLVFLAIMLPMMCLCWAGVATLFNTPRMSGGVIASLVILEALLIVGASVTMSLSGLPDSLI